MNYIQNLPLEIQWNVFQRLSDKGVNSLMVNRVLTSIILQFRVSKASLTFCSCRQLQTFLDLGNEEVLFNLRHAILLFPITDHDVGLVSQFIRKTPHLKQMTIGEEVFNANPYPSTIIKTPTTINFNHFPFWYKNNFIVKINEEKANRRMIKSLAYSLGTHLPSNSTIQLQPIGSMTTRFLRHHSLQNSNSNNNHHQVITFPSMVLIMPRFIHLSNLSLALKQYQFYPISYEYEMDEKILISIHLACPKLESLTVYDYYFNISDNYTDTFFNDISYRAQGLKSFSMVGAIFDRRCCSFFNLIYPQLESFTYIYSYKKMNDYSTHYLQSAFMIMVQQFPLLKKLSLRSICYDSSNCHYWPSADSFIQFLNDHPYQLTTIDYPSSLFPIGHHPHNNNNKIVPNGLWLNYIKSLKLRSQALIETVTNCLLYHNDANTVTISDSLTELIIYDDKLDDNNGIYLFDWLLLFPKLTVLKTENQLLVDEDEDDGDDDDTLFNRYTNNDSMYVLHKLINERKQHDDSYKKKAGTYKLDTLALKNVRTQYVNGLTSLFIHFRHLNRLILKKIHIPFIGWYGSDLPGYIKSICLNVPHLSLDYLLVHDIRIYSWNDNNPFYLERLVKKIILVEHSSGKKSTCHYSIPSGKNDLYYRALSRCHPNTTFTFKLFCKHIDKLIFY